MRKLSLEITAGVLEPLAEGQDVVHPKPGRVNRLVMQHLAGKKIIPRRIPRTLKDIRIWFWKNIIINESGCWEWKRPRDVNGYGVCRVNGHKYRAHRVAYLLTHGTLPIDRLVCHHCDNPPCVNPKHLFLGDDKINHRDAVDKGRKFDCRGMNSFSAVFTDNDVLWIRKRYDSGEGCRKMGRELGVHHSTISAIGKRKTWKHL